MPIKYLNRNNNSTTISAGNSVQFNGSNYLSVPTSSVFTLGTNNHTIEFWIYQTSRGTYDVSWEYGSSTVFASNAYYMNIGSAGCNLLLGNGSGGWGVIISKSLPTLNAWHHVAIVRNSNTFTLYIDGVGTSATYAANISAQALTMKIGSDYSTNRITGYISNFRFINGTAVYTSNFTPSTTPLTAIDNTSLLTCNAATIIDGSSNNFTITNNGSATVSATVPFTASISTPKGIKFKNRSNVGTLKMKKVFADAATLVTNGLVLNLDASNASSYPGSGTTWTNLSGAGNNGTLVNGVGYNSNNGGSLVFDGSNDYIDIGISTSSGARTFSIWLKSTQTGDAVFFSFGNNDWSNNIGIANWGNNLILFGSNNNANLFDSQSLIRTGNWVNVVITQSDSTNATIISYINGSVGTQRTGVTGIAYSGTTNNIGRRNDNAVYFSGNIAHALIYNRALSASEVLQNYNVTKTRFGL